MKYIIAHDFGTSSVKSAIFSVDGELLKSHIATYPTYRLPGGKIEQDSEDWWTAFCENNKTLTEGIDRSDVICVAFDGTTSSCVCCDENGKPLHKAIIWQDTRATEEGQEIMSMLTPELAEGRRAMGPGRSGVQLYWIKKHWPDVFEKADKFILNNSNYICFKLTGKSVCDKQIGWSGGFLNAERTGWTYELIDMLGIPHKLIPELHKETDIIGEIPENLAEECGLAAGTKLMIGTGDGETVTIGAGLVHNGDASLICGTSGGASVIGYNKNFPGTSATGGAFEWLRRNYCQEEERIAAETGKDVFNLIIEKAQMSPIGSNGVMFCPYLAGERGSRKNPKAKGAFVGLGLSTTREDMIRSVLEGIALNLNELIQHYRDDGQVIESVTAVGGMTKNAFVRQMFADVINADVVTVQNASWTGPVGAAMLACVAMGVCKDLAEAASKFVCVDTVTKPIAENHEKYKKLPPLFEDVYQSQIPLYEKFFDLNL